MKNEALIYTASPFQRLATLAAETEKAGAYDFAATAWKAAAAVAQRDCNQQWANERSALCKKALARGWGMVEGSAAENDDVKPNVRPGMSVNKTGRQT
jgi:hypothetical protein